MALAVVSVKTIQQGIECPHRHNKSQYTKRWIISIKPTQTSQSILDIKIGLVMKIAHLSSTQTSPAINVGNRVRLLY